VEPKTGQKFEIARTEQNRASDTQTIQTFPEPSHEYATGIAEAENHEDLIMNVF
jgi:hypothetical protein